MTRTQLCTSLIVTVVCTVLTQVSNGAVITSMQDSTPTEAEVVNQNVLVAVNLGENQSSTASGYAAAVNVNGVNFVPISTALPGNGASTPISETFGSSPGQIQLQTIARGFTTFRASDFDGNSTSDITAPLSSLYDPIIAGNNNNTGVDITLDLSSLQVGASYQLQLFLASSNQTTRIIDVLQNGSTLLATYDNSTPHAEILDLTWLADQATEQIVLRSNVSGSGVPVLSGFALSYTPVPIPEPSSCLLLSLGMIGLMRHNRRRRKA